MKTVVLFLFAFCSLAAHAQIISKFTWDANPVTKAAVGPDGISVSTSATSSANGVGGTKGLNPGTPAQNVNLVVPGSPYFDVPGIDISVSFRREESQASFFMRGANFDFGMNGGSLYVTFTLNQGSNAVATVINSGSVYTLANDHAFHVYRFRYDNVTGIGNLYVDNTIVYTYKGTAGYTMNWTGAGNAVIGTNMDATGNNVAILDNMVIQKPVTNALPLTLLSFTAIATANTSLLNWSTTQEVNSASFIIERSADGTHFEAIGTVAAKDNYSGTNTYSYIDNAPVSPISYYRLKMVDMDGSFTYSDVKEVSFSTAKTSISCYPNPTVDYVNLRIDASQAARYSYKVSTLDGKTVLASSIAVNTGVQQASINLLATPAKGVLIIQLQNNSTHSIESFKIVKQ